MWNTKDFLSQKDNVIKYFKKKEVTEGNIAEYCALSGIPLVVVYEFIAEEMPEYAEMCRRKMREIKEFFGM